MRTTTGKINKFFAALLASLCVAAFLDIPEPLHAYASVNTDQQHVESIQNGGNGKYQDQIDNISQKMKSLEAEKKVIEQNINAAKSEKEKEIANKNYLDKQISITEDEIGLLLERITLLEEDIEIKRAEIDDKQAEYEANYSLFLKRLGNMQLNTESTKLEIVLGSGDFAGYVTANEMMSRITEYDKELMKKVKAERAALEQQKANFENDKELLEADKKEAEEKEKLLASQKQTAVLRIQDMDELERQFKADLAKNKALSDEMQNELKKIYQQIEWDKNPYVGGEMAWPVPGYFNITSQYGWRWGKTDFHTGVDISGSGVYGKGIAAANDGKVVFVNTSYVANRGYGIYLMIDHGGKTSTLYGHCSKIVVSVGEVVKKGQKIAEVGSTGWSTGPHLHFEVRIDSGHVPPMPYLTK